MTRRLLTVLAPLLAIIAPAGARAESDTQLWLTGSASVDLSKRIVLNDEIVARFSDNQHGLYEVEDALLLGFRVNPKVTLSAGYVHDPLYAQGHFRRMEHRLREQASFDNVVKFGKVAVSVRMRVEQRWREEMDGQTWRARPFVRIAAPLDAAGTTTLALSHESFIDLDKASFQPTTGWSRMRNQLALRHKFGPHLSLEAAYLNQYTRVRAAADRDDNVAVLGLVSSF